MPVADWTVRNEILEEGKVLLSITLATDELASLIPPAPFFTLVSRQAYFSSIFSDIFAHFNQYIVKSDQVWLHVNQNEQHPLPVQHPLGVILDIFFPVPHIGAFELTVRFSTGRANFLSSASLASMYINQLKAALALRDKTSFQNFHKLTKDHILKLQTVAYDSAGSGPPGSGHAGQGLAGSDSSGLVEILDKHVFQGVDVLKVPFKVYFLRSGETGHRGVLEYATAVELPRATVADAVKQVCGNSDAYCVYLQGIEVPMEAELLWLSLHAAALDGWLHFVLKRIN